MAKSKDAAIILMRRMDDLSLVPAGSSKPAAPNDHVEGAAPFWSRDSNQLVPPRKTKLLKRAAEFRATPIEKEPAKTVVKHRLVVRSCDLTCSRRELLYLAGNRSWETATPNANQ